MGFVISVNLVAMCLFTQYRALHTAYVLGLRPDDASWSEVRARFDVTEYLFCTVYMLELSARIVFLGWKHIRKPWNMIDACVVIITSAGTIVYPLVGWSS